MFSHLQVYSSYNFQDSTILIEDLCKQASQLKMDILALTDKNTMFGALEFNKFCKRYNIKPIFGMETSVSIDGEIYPLVILAKDNVGYDALVTISSHINTNEERSINLESLEQYKDHLFYISSGSNSIIERLLLKEMDDQAIQYIKRFQKLFGKQFYICIQDHNIALQKRINEKLIAVATLLNVPICCSNEVRYLYLEDALTLDLLKASKRNQTLDLFHEVKTNQKYLKNHFEMEELFKKEYIDNTNYIASLCNVSIEVKPMNLPKYPTPNTIPSSSYLQQLCVAGLKKRRNGHVDNIDIERLQKELSVIVKMGFEDYFLIVFDYVRFAKKNKIIVGPGRGSAAGSLVSYVLGITDIDPLQYDLLFERFLNEERVSMPDIDIDFEDTRRDEVVNYVIKKYGQEYVAQIVTFSTYGPKNTIRDLSKVMGISPVKIDMLSKLMPTNPKESKSIYEMYQTSHAFQSMVNREAGFKKIFRSLTIVEKLPRNTSTHAAGIVLSKEPLSAVVPIIHGPTNTVVTQYTKDYIEDIGLLKMDFLGLKNLTIIHTIINIVEQYTNTKLDITKIPLDDKLSYKIISSGDTFGIFQLESPGMRSLLQKMKCDSLDDIIAAIALFRPGPMENIPTYIRRKHKIEKVEYPLDDIKDICKSTYGILIYQEQIMQVATRIAGFSLAKADILRKAMSKKATTLMNTLKEEFIQGGVSNGYPLDKVESIYALIEKFANYGFNKSHSVAYGYIAYQLAYLKANYPLAFFSAILTNEQGSAYAKAKCIQECKKYHVEILPPSINQSKDYFSIEEGSIRYSLLAIKNVGHAGYLAIDRERKKGIFTSIFDFFMRMESTKLNSLMLTSLIDAGAFDEFSYSRETIKANIDKIHEYSELRKLGISEPPILTMVSDKTIQKLENEKSVLGIYLTMHPLTIVKEKIQVNTIPIVELEQHINKKIDVVICLQRVKHIVDKKGNDMCFIEGYDESGQIDGVVFSNTYKQVKEAMHRGNICLFRVKVDKKEKLSIIVENAKVLT